MSMSGRIALPVVCGLVLGVGSVFLVLERAALSYPPDAKPSAKWEYTTVEVEVGALQVKLDELGNAEWEVFDINRVDSTVDQAGDGKTHLKAEKFQVTAKRPKK